jgi:hypothetical protein
MAGDQSLKAWIEALLEDRDCMDCKAAIEGLEGTMEFHGPLLYVECIGYLCLSCWERRERIRQVRHEQSEEQ